MIWSQVLAQAPLVAILRGIEPDEAIAVGEALVAAGLLCLEVPLNSPQPLESIRRLREALRDRALVGAGTVLTPRAVDDVVKAGGQIIVSPNADPAVIAHTKARGLVSLPAFFTPTEAFAAIAAGADALKLFPAEASSPTSLKAMGAVLPPGAPVFAVGGVDAINMGPWIAAGARGFGVGSTLYKPGRPAHEVGERAARLVEAWALARRT